jgi:tricarballylate dehydrogenase
VDRGADGFDVVVAGAGNAAMCAALAARERGARVLVLEGAPEHWRGGNTHFTGGGFRFPYDTMDDIRRLIPDMSDAETRAVDVGAYPRAQMLADWRRVTEGRADPALVEAVVSRAAGTMSWMRDAGLRWELQPGRQAFVVGGVRKFWGGLVVQAAGGGGGLSEAQFALADRAGIEVRYEAPIAGVRMHPSGAIAGAIVRDGGALRDVTARAVVLACGGFEADANLRARHLGAGWRHVKVRGTPYNTGGGITAALAAGAAPYGQWDGCHAVAWDLNAPPHGNRAVGDLYQKHSYPFGIVVNVEGRRFVDEGADFRNYTYARYGREIMAQPHRAAFQVFDAKVTHLLRDEYRIARATKAEAETIEQLAEALGIAAAGLARTVREFNAAVVDGPFNPTVLDGKHTYGIDPPKSNWALPIDTPPYLGYAVTCGITFTFGGLRIDADAHVLDTRGAPIPGLYAAGELVGGLFHSNYAGGSGLMAGSVFGRIAGEAAAQYLAQQ